MKYLAALGMAINQFFNAATGGLPDESTSSRVGRARDRGAKPAAIACHLLDWTDPRDGDGPLGDHCAQSVAKHLKRQQDRIARMEAEGAANVLPD